MVRVDARRLRRYACGRSVKLALSIMIPRLGERPYRLPYSLWVSLGSEFLVGILPKALCTDKRSRTRARLLSSTAAAPILLAPTSSTAVPEAAASGSINPLELVHRIIPNARLGS